VYISIIFVFRAMIYTHIKKNVYEDFNLVFIDEISAMRILQILSIFLLFIL